VGQKLLALRSTLSGIGTVLLDTSVLIYHFEAVEPYYALTREIFRAIGSGQVEGVISVVSVTEFVVKPFGDGKLSAVEHFKRFITSLAIQVLSPNYEMAERAGKLRAHYQSLRTADALVVSTALESECDAVVTNDTDLKKLEAEGITVVILSDFVERSS